MKKLILLAALLTLPGCATALGILDILAPDPVPVCDKDSVGATHVGQQCLKYSDGSYMWASP